METTIILSDIRDQFRSELADYYSENEILQLFSITTEYLLNYAKIDTFMRAGEPISSEIAEKFSKVLRRLKNWEPIQYIMGHSYFYGLLFKVDKRVLIPRQETEELVQWIIKSENSSNRSLLDIGTGSGCIAVALAKNMAGLEVSACDVSEEALTVTMCNALLNNAGVKCFRFDLLDDSSSLPSKYDIMVSNPPYVRSQEQLYMKPNVLNFEPGLALFVPDKDPLLFYKRIALLARKHLTDGGSLYLEINENFPVEVKRLLESTGFYAIEIRHDLSGRNRMIRARK